MSTKVYSVDGILVNERAYISILETRNESLRTRLEATEKERDEWKEKAEYLCPQCGSCGEDLCCREKRCVYPPEKLFELESKLADAENVADIAKYIYQLRDQDKDYDKGQHWVDLHYALAAYDSLKGEEK